MDFAKLEAALGEVLVPEVVEKAMSAEEFEAYAREQITVAKGESTEEARERLTALKEQVEAVTKFDFKPGELPKVKFYKAKEQKRPVTGSQGAEDQVPASNSSFTAKASELGKLVNGLLGDGTATIAEPGKVAPQTETEETAFVWPKDLAADDSN